MRIIFSNAVIYVCLFINIVLQYRILYILHGEKITIFYIIELDMQ